MADTKPAPQPPAAPAPPPAALAPLGAGLDKTTENLADDVRTLTHGLGEVVESIVPPLGGVVGKAGEVLADIVEGAGHGLARALGHRR